MCLLSRLIIRDRYYSVKTLPSWKGNEGRPMLKVKEGLDKETGPRIIGHAGWISKHDTFHHSNNTTSIKTLRLLLLK